MVTREWTGKYLIRKRGQMQKAHYWTGFDTVCRLWSTGGMKKARFYTYDTALGKEICWMCGNGLKKAY